MGVRIERRIGSKGQVVIPSQIRHDFGLEPGTEVEFDVEKGNIILIPKAEEGIVEMFERDARESGKKASEILVGDELYEKIFSKS